MKKVLLNSIFAIGLMIFAGASASAQSIEGSLGSVARGRATRGTVVMTIPGGLHVNSNRPNSQYAIPTTVRVTSSNARLSAVSYPRGKNRKFQFSENAINVYEGRVAFNFNVTVPANFRGNRISVRAVVRYQACTDEVCYPPKSQEITLTANVR
jgi:thiol:disulfide interchange protein